jgi:hypothetical protein
MPAERTTLETGPTKPFCLPRENRRKDRGRMVPVHDRQWSLVMLAYLFSVIYRLSCRATLSAIRMQRLAR